MLKGLKMKYSMNIDTKKALTAYSAGKMSRTELEDFTGLWFGDVLLELAKLELPLPRYNSSSRYTPEQKEMYDELFGPS